MNNSEIASHNLKVSISWEWEIKKYKWRPITREMNLIYSEKKHKFIIKYEINKN